MQLHAPVVKNPLLSAFVFGFFFGAIVIPCNPAFIAAMFTKSVVSGLGFVANMINFILFGAGMGFPLIVISLISSTKSQYVITFLAKHKSIINRVAGILMLLVSLYYIIFVFRLYGLL
jgi:cytochrome c-type biogenesis protein